MRLCCQSGGRVFGCWAQSPGLYGSLPASCHLWPIVQPGLWATLGLSMICVSRVGSGRPGGPPGFSPPFCPCLTWPGRPAHPRPRALARLVSTVPPPASALQSVLSSGSPFPLDCLVPPSWGLSAPDAWGSLRGECGGLFSILAVGRFPVPGCGQGQDPAARRCLFTAPQSQSVGVPSCLRSQDTLLPCPPAMEHPRLQPLSDPHAGCPAVLPLVCSDHPPPAASLTLNSPSGLWPDPT